MAEKAKTCPHCGAPLSFRLGEFECAACGHIEALQPAAGSGSKPEERSTDYGGVRRAKLLPPPPPSSMPSPGGSEYGDTRYSGQRSWEGSYASPPEGISSDQLHREKMIYMGVEALLMLIGACAAASPDSSTGTGGGGGGFLIGLGGGAIDFLLYWLVLFGSMSCLKWTCFGFTMLWVLGNLAAALIVIPIISGTMTGLSPGGVAVGGLATGLIFTFLFGALALRAWLAWILWRDLHYGQY